MDEKSETAQATAPIEEDPMDVQRRAIREAVRRRLRGEVTTAAASRGTQGHQHRMCYSSGDLSSDIAFNPLIFPPKTS